MKIFLDIARRFVHAAPMSVAVTAPDPTPTRSGRLLFLVRKLIEFGQGLAMALYQRTLAPAELDATRNRFGTADIGAIIASILRGLQRARALETRLESTAPQLDAPPRPGRPSAPRAATTPPEPRAEAPDGETTPLTPEQRIVAEARRRPIGAVLANICRDLGITAQHPLWRELQLAIIFEGGSFARLTEDLAARFSRFFLSRVPDPTARLIPPLPAAAGTGPP